MEKVNALLAPSKKLYERIMQHAVNEYTGSMHWDFLLQTLIPTVCVSAGFRVPSTDWKPTEFAEMPSASDFNNFVQRREPVVIRGGGGGADADALQRALGWGTGKWTQQYMEEAAGDVLVSVEQRRKLTSEEDGSIAKQKLFGFGMDIARKTMPFKDFAARYFSDDRSDEWEEYLNIQILRDRNNSIWRPPLYAQALRDDIPTPRVLEQYVATGDMQDVSLWMGKSHATGALTSLFAYVYLLLLTLCNRSGHQQSVAYGRNG
jgi:hypothetical protein